jgi:hypothetical protein
MELILLKICAIVIRIVIGELMTPQSINVNKYGAVVNDLWTGSDILYKQRWRTNVPWLSFDVNIYGG